MIKSDVLFVSAHPDDAEIFAGGTISKLVERGDRVHVALVTYGRYKSLREAEFFDSMSKLGVDESNIHLLYNDYPTLQDTLLYKEEHTVIKAVENVINNNNIKTVVTHHPHDSHNDHRVVGTSSLAASRYIDNVIFYNPTWPSGRTQIAIRPNLIISITKDQMNRKIDALFCHKSQISKYGEDDYIEAIKSFMRGTSLSNTGNVKGYAESFEINRIIL